MLPTVILCFMFTFSLPFSSCHKDVHGADDVESIPLLVISVDAFRWNFVDRIRRLRTETGADVRSRLWNLIEKGAYAQEGISSAFPTTSSPSQYTLVTGLFAESHGVVSEIVYDPILNRTADLKLRSADDGWVFGGEPIWKTLEKQSSGEKSAAGLVGCYMWIGCEHGGVSKSVPFKWNTIWHDRVDKAIEWLKDGLQLVLISSPDIDNIGRTDGPDSVSMDDALIRFDADIAYLLKRLETEELLDRTNLVIVSGHGITKSIQERPILPHNAPRDSYVRSRTPTMWLVEPSEGGENETVAYFKQFERLRVFSKKDIPKEWHYENSHRIPSVMVLAEPGYILSEAADRYHRGLYGYDNSIRDMRGTFIGYGPAFLANSSISAMSTVDVYQILCLLLNVIPASNNGSTKYFETFLQPNYLKRLSAWTETNSFPIIPVVILLVILVLGILIGGWLFYRSGDCSRDRRQAIRDHDRAKTVESTTPGEKTPIMHKYESELVILDLDDGAVDTVKA